MTTQYSQKLIVMISSIWLVGLVYGLTPAFGSSIELDAFKSACQLEDTIFLAGQDDNSCVIVSYTSTGEANLAFNQNGQLVILPEESGYCIDIQPGSDGLLWVLGVIGDSHNTVVTSLFTNGTTSKTWRSTNPKLALPKRLIFLQEKDSIVPAAYVLFEKRKSDISDKGFPAFSVDRIKDENFDDYPHNNGDFVWHNIASYFDGSSLFTVDYLESSKNTEAVSGEFFRHVYVVSRHTPSGEYKILAHLPNKIYAMTSKGDTLFLAGDKYVARLKKLDGDDNQGIAVASTFYSLDDTLHAFGRYEDKIVLGNINSLKEAHPRNIILIGQYQAEHGEISINGQLHYQGGFLIYGKANSGALLIKIDAYANIDHDFAKSKEGICFANCNTNIQVQQQTTNQNDNRYCQGSCDLSGGSKNDASLGQKQESTQSNVMTNTAAGAIGTFSGFGGGVIVAVIAVCALNAKKGKHLRHLRNLRNRNFRKK